MVQRNRTRANYQERFQRLIDDYNAGTLSIDAFFAGLTVLSQEVETEAERGKREGLTEEELAVADLLRLPDRTLTDADWQALKAAVQDLLESLKREALVLDWRKRQQSRAQVETLINDRLDAALPPTYSREQYQLVCAAVFEHMYDAYAGQGKSVYGEVA